MIPRRLCFALLIALQACFASAQGWTPAWTKKIVSQPSNANLHFQVITDPTGNTFFFGTNDLINESTNQIGLDKDGNLLFNRTTTLPVEQVRPRIGMVSGGFVGYLQKSLAKDSSDGSQVWQLPLPNRFYPDVKPQPDVAATAADGSIFGTSVITSVPFESPSICELIRITRGGAITSRLNLPGGTIGLKRCVDGSFRALIATRVDTGILYQVEKLDALGALQWRLPLTSGKLYTLFEVDNAGDMYLSYDDQLVGCFVQRVSPEGQLLWSMAPVPGDHTILKPSQLLPDHQNNVLVIGRQHKDTEYSRVGVYKISSNGDLLWHSGFSPLGNNSPTKACLSSTDHVYVGAMQVGGHSVLAFDVDSTGALASYGIVAGNWGWASEPWIGTIDAEDNFFLSGNDGGKFSISRFTPPLDDNAAFVSRTGSVGVYAGHGFYAQYTMRNTSTEVWTPANGYRIVSINPRGNTVWGSDNIAWPGNVALVRPNSTITFTGLMTAPITPGTYPMQWQMEHNGRLIGQATPSVNIAVYASSDDADFISQGGVLTSLAPGKTFSANLTMKNLGTQSWGSNQDLVSIGSSNFGVPSIVAGTTLPGNTFAFTATFTAPAIPGIYCFRYRMANGSVMFGRSTPTTTIIVGADSAQFVSYAGASGWYAGTDFYPSFTMRNTGATTWTQASGYSMIALNPGGNTTFGVNRLLVPSTANVAPGSTVACVNLCTAPAVPGCYVFQWKMAKNGIPFGDKTPYMIVTSYRGLDDSYFVAYGFGLPTTIGHGQTFQATIVMSNAGTATQWDSSYVLYPVGNSFGVSSIPLAQPATVQARFSATFEAPTTPGLHKFQWRMMHGGKWMGQSSTPVTIKVT